MAHHTTDQPARDRLFVGTYPCGIVYADRQREKAGDFARLAFLSYDSLELQIESDCPKALQSLIEAEALAIQARRGQPFQISTCGQTVTLGWRLDERKGESEIRDREPKARERQRG